ncbi:MAG: hypothetical protein ACREPE_10695 [Lysobacter sp.]
MGYLKAAMVALSLLAFAGAVQAGTALLVDPEPVAIPAGLSTTKVVKDIKRTLAGRGWAVTSEQEGQIDSTLTLRAHVARIRISYDDKQVRIAYVDSSNLDYKLKRGKAYVHSNYMGWMGYLTTDLATNLQLSTTD